MRKVLNNNQNKPMHERIIYLITRKLIKEKYPEELPLFEISWDGIREFIEQQKDASPKNWSLEDYRRVTLPYYASPEQFDKLRLHSIGLTISAALNDLSILAEKPSQDRIEKIVKTYGVQFKTPAPLIPDIVSLLVKSIDTLEFEPLKNKQLIKIDIKRKIYEAFLYNKSKPIDLNDMELKEFQSKYKKKDFRIWINEIQHDFIIDKKAFEIEPTPLAILEELLINFPHIVLYEKLFNKFAFVDRIFDAEIPEQDLRLVYRWKANLWKIHEVLYENIKTVPTKGYQWKNAIEYCIIRLKDKKRRKSLKAYY